MDYIITCIHWVGCCWNGGEKLEDFCWNNPATAKCIYTANMLYMQRRAFSLRHLSWPGLSLSLMLSGIPATPASSAWPGWTPAAVPVAVNVVDRRRLLAPVDTRRPSSRANDCRRRFIDTFFLLYLFNFASSSTSAAGHQHTSSQHPSVTIMTHDSPLTTRFIHIH